MITPSESPVGVSGERSVPILQATALCARVLIRQIVTPGKLVTLCLLGVAMVGVGMAIGWPSNDVMSMESQLGDGAFFVAGLGLALVVPIVSVVFASSVLGDAREDGTLVYLWLRPMDRSAVAAGAMGAAVAAALPLTVIPVGVGGWLAAGRVTGSGELALAGLTASAFGTVAYASMFMLIGLLLKRPVMWGIFYVLVWEGLAAQISDSAALFSLRGYTQSLSAQMTSFDWDLSITHSTVTSVAVLAGITVASTGLAVLRLNRMDIV